MESIFILFSIFLLRKIIKIHFLVDYKKVVTGKKKTKVFLYIIYTCPLPVTYFDIYIYICQISQSTIIQKSWIFHHQYPFCTKILNQILFWGCFHITGLKLPKKCRHTRYAKIPHSLFPSLVSVCILQFLPHNLMAN